MVLPADVYDREDLTRFLADYGAALGAGDLDGVADRFGFPSLLVAADRSVLVTDPETVLDSHRERLAAYRADDLVAAVPELRTVEEVTDELLWAGVRWSYRDENAAEGAADEVRYLLRRSRDGFEVCVIVPLRS
ncbi:hypothetical protein [Antribacter gilvus]|uniref:hypothetical protein n=1 Tax=Antribacter gilvus TaxID=2304675 RepID=UPI000F7A2EB6|nr:hypothetical protein [Antribacter gilvus]